MAKASNNEFPSVLFDEQASDVSTPGSGLWRAYFKSDGLYVIDDAGSVSGPLGTGGGGGALSSVQASSTSGDIAFASTAATGIDIDTGLDLTLAASADDKIMVGLSGIWLNEANSAFLDFYTWDGAAVVNPVGPGLNRAGGSERNGLSYAKGQSGQYGSVGGSTIYTVVAGDIVTGNVTFRLRGQTGAGTPNRTIQAQTAVPLTVWAVHLG